MDVETIRGEDGFWLRSDSLEPGTYIAYRYFVDGQPKTGRVQYSPGPKGHFIYTGDSPDTIDVTSVAAAAVLLEQEESTWSTPSSNQSIVPPIDPTLPPVSIPADPPAY